MDLREALIYVAEPAQSDLVIDTRPSLKFQAQRYSKMSSEIYVMTLELQIVDLHCHNLDAF